MIEAALDKLHSDEHSCIVLLCTVLRVFAVLMVLCFIGIITLFFSIPNLYKQDIHFLRNDTIHQEI